MDLKGKVVMVLGGFGLVGMAVCRKVAEEGAKTVIVTSLNEDEAVSASDILKKEFHGVTFTPDWGDLFVRTDFKDIPRKELLKDPQRRKTFIRDILDPLTPAVAGRITLYHQIVHHKPDIVIDCVNTATGIAYQDLYEQSELVLDKLDRSKGKPVDDEFVTMVEDLIASLNAPQLVRHIQVLHNALVDGNVRGYLKVGTTGTGGMGLNIPYTHSEDRPSRVLLTKNAMGGAQTLMLLLMARTPLQQDDGSVREIFVKEVKPAAAIAWKGVKAGEIRKKGQNFPRFDLPLDKAVSLNTTLNTDLSEGPWELKNDTLRSVYIDTGENGIFSEGEFTAITEVGQMEFVTPEEIAQHVVWEIMGGSSGHDVIGALDGAVMEPSYRAGVLRQVALNKLRQMMKRSQAEGMDLDESVAFELLGPPRLTKLLHEANLLRHAYTSMRNAVEAAPTEMAKAAVEVLKTHPKLRSAILSVGIPILLPDGKTLLRGPKLLIPHHPVKKEFEVTPESLEAWCAKGWVDLRPSHMKEWDNWFTALVQQKDRRSPEDTSSRYDFDEDYFDPDQEINPGKMAAWIFINVDKGKRTKR
ncbi:MAG: short-chain dehydrogenase [bacterium]